MATTKRIIRLDSFNSSKEIEDINITSDELMFGLKSDSTVESILNEHRRKQLMVEQRMIKYDVMINRTNNDSFPEISFDDIEKYDFKNKAFIEVIKLSDYIHLYFDFDSMMYDEEKKREKDNKLKGVDEIIVMKNN